MAILYNEGKGVRELSIEDFYRMIKDSDFYLVDTGRKFSELSGSKIKTQAGRLARMEQVVIMPLNL